MERILYWPGQKAPGLKVHAMREATVPEAHGPFISVCGRVRRLETEPVETREPINCKDCHKVLDQVEWLFYRRRGT